MEITRKARGTQLPKRGQKVFLGCGSQGDGERARVVADLLSMDAGMDCVVSYAEGPIAPFDAEALRDELMESQAMVLLVTEGLLAAWEDSAPLELRLAQET
ncbi:MAG: hypothetical protein FWD72_00450, partial [Eggerthellaceae bacterium]|nr:hypothetical protein [Eggerthellaceae bacterium]